MTSFGAVVIARNDNYGGNLTERAGYCLNSLTDTFDEVIYVDWNTPDDKVSLIEEAKGLVIKSPKLKWIRVTSEQASEWTNHDTEAQVVCEVMARNIGLRRLTTDFLVSTNIDVICPYRSILDEQIQLDSGFVTTAKRGISLYDLRKLGTSDDIDEVRDELLSLEPWYNQQPSISIRGDDKYSLVSSPGDFQIAHRDVWYTIRGFEERLYKRAYADTNIQQKAAKAGIEIKVNRAIPVWHIGHEVGMGGTGGMNDMNLALTMPKTTNLETWGFSNVDLEVRTW